MMSPRSGTGANTAERVPTTTSASPRLARFHSSYRSPARRELWRTATRFPKCEANILNSCGVSTISGTSTRAFFPRESTWRMSWIYTWVLPLPVTPYSRAAAGFPPRARASRPSTARCCSSLSRGGGAGSTSSRGARRSTSRLDRVRMPLFSSDLMVGMDAPVK